MKKWISVFLPFTIYASCPVTEISCPCYSGGLFGGGSWDYLQPMQSDADLQQGTLLTLTDDPPNLTARVIQVAPSYQNSFDLHLGYQIPCSNQSLKLEYFYLKSRNSKKKSIEQRNQFFQNFLGSSYDRSFSHAKHQIHRLDVVYGLDFAVDCCTGLHPFFGVGFADIQRGFHVFFEDLLEFSPTLVGDEMSKYWGVGPVFGTDFTWPLFRHLNLGGHFEIGFFFGKTRSQLDSESVRNNVPTPFFAKDVDHQAVGMFNTKLYLAFTQPIYDDRYQLELEVGYRVDTYLKPINRINPFNGYVNNSNTFPVNQPSNIGFQGPYITVNLAPGIPCLSSPFLCTPLRGVCTDTNLFFHFINAWLKPWPSKNDLSYAFLDEGSQRLRRNVTPNTTWASLYLLGVQFCSSYDLQGKYFHLDTHDRASTTAIGNEQMESIHASGFSFVRFSEAFSEAKYEIDQVDLTVGKLMQIFCPLNLHGYFGLRYLHLNRQVRNRFLGGKPPEITQEKYPVLKSHFKGIGPIFGIEPRFHLFGGIDLIGRFDTALVIGNIKSTLTQQNVGQGDVSLFEVSSNALSTPRIPSITPIVDAKGGVSFQTQLRFMKLYLEAGYQYTSYYRGIDLVFPTFLTGLEQNNSNLKLTGPYLEVGLDICF